MKLLSTLSKITLIIPLILTSACGGGGGDSSLSPSLATPGNALTWTTGVFDSANSLDNQCDANLNDSGLAEKLWMRSWSNDTYLWYNEIDDQDPAGYSINDYFHELKTTALTESGSLKDRFHFSMSTEEWDQLNQSGASVGYGFHIHIQSADETLGLERKITVTFSESDSPAADNNISRGAVIVEVDGVNVELASDSTSIDTLNNGLFPSTSGQETVFTLLDQGSDETREVTLTAQTITSIPVNKVSTLTTDTGKVGYIQFNSHIATAEKGLVDAIEVLKAAEVSDLVLDLRYNGGGLLALASQLGYMIAGNSTTDKTFEKLTFNDKYPNTNPVTGNTLSPTPFYTQTIGFNTSLLIAGEELPTLNLPRVYVLTSEDTCSASESLMNSLRGINVEVIQIGTTTCGKPYGFYPTPNCGTTYFSVQFKGENEVGFGDYADGFSPSSSPTFTNEIIGCLVADDFSQALGDTNEALLSAALQYRSNETCPVEASSLSYQHMKKQSKANTGQIKDNRNHTIFNKNRVITTQR
jgi:C-terminal processing protease CtpA/Prc